MNVTFATYTDIGDREKNEDSFLAEFIHGEPCFVIADGLGGHSGGDVASRLVCETAREVLHHRNIRDSAFFSELFGQCQKALLDIQESSKAEGHFRTTMNFLGFTREYACWAHIGDSRTYYFQDKRFICRTFDHSVPQMLAAMGELQEKDIRFHEDRNRLLKVMGVASAPPQFQVQEPVPLVGNQQFLLCTDGFWEYISEEQILLCLDEADTPQLWLDNMLELISRNSRTKVKDNLTAIAVWISK